MDQLKFKEQDMNLNFVFSVEKLSFEAPLVTNTTPDPPEGASRFSAITQGWQQNDEDNPEVPYIIFYSFFPRLNIHDYALKLAAVLLPPFPD